MKKRVLSVLLAGIIAVSSMISASAAVGTPATPDATVAPTPPNAVEEATQVSTTTAIDAVVKSAVTEAVASIQKEVKAIVDTIVAIVKESGVSQAEAIKQAGITVPTASKPIEVTVAVKNVTKVEVSQLQEVLTTVQTAAKEAGLANTSAVKPILAVQTTDKAGEVIIEVKVDVAAAIKAGTAVQAGGKINQGGSTFGTAATVVAKVLDTAAVANVKQVSFEARTTFPVRTTVSIKASTLGYSASTNLTALNYYSYQAASNKFIKLNVKNLAPKYDNGMIVINTKYAGDLIITPTPLTKK